MESIRIGKACVVSPFSLPITPRALIADVGMQ